MLCQSLVAFEGKSSHPVFLPLSDAFQCRILLCLWHVRRGWLKGLLKHCHNFDVQREMFKHLGRILYCTRNASSTADAVEEFLQIYIDQSEFVEYFRNKWFPKIGTVLPGYLSSCSSVMQQFLFGQVYYTRLVNHGMQTLI